MNQLQLEKLLEQLISYNRETEWIEFKHNNSNPDEIGEYISSLSNSACLLDIEFAYIIWGIEDGTLKIIGTDFRPRIQKRNGQELENFLSTTLDPRIHFDIFELTYNGNPIVIFQIQRASYIPVKFNGTEYIRVGSYKKKLKDHPERERILWDKLKHRDWSAMICENATFNDLDPSAISSARDFYKLKHPEKISEIDNWDNITFLNKAKVTINGNITKTAIILLGKEESEHFIHPSISQITWTLKDKDNADITYEHFYFPFLLSTGKIFNKIRNEKYRYIPDGTIFPKEVKKYESYVIREALHNCIAHCDYSKVCKKKNKQATG